MLLCFRLHFPHVMRQDQGSQLAEHWISEGQNLDHGNLLHQVLCGHDPVWRRAWKALVASPYWRRFSLYLSSRLRKSHRMPDCPRPAQMSGGTGSIYSLTSFSLTSNVSILNQVLIGTTSLSNVILVSCELNKSTTSMTKSCCSLRPLSEKA